MTLSTLRLRQLADSAFPIGAAAHSFGLETLVAMGSLSPQTLQPLLADLLTETGQMEARFVRLAYRLAQDAAPEHVIEPWLQLNLWLAALKPARESREASATLGRRFVQTVAHLAPSPLLQQAQAAAKAEAVEIHYCAAFGLVGGVLALGEEESVSAYLQQSSMGLVSAALRLLPIGQGRAGEILWSLQPLIAEVTAASRAALAAWCACGEGVAQWEEELAQLSLFTPMLDLASMRHPTLTTRLFIS
ncbi:MAG: urease accessory UreF family protein [Caldilineaceae bacterium]